MPECTVIATASTPFDDPSAAPRQGRSTPGSVEVAPAYRDGLVGLEAYDRVVIVWYADQAHREVLRYPDRDVGVFALRTVDRPTPIGITRCALKGIDDGVLELRGVDMLDGTPVIDIKPVLNGPADHRATA